MSDESRDMVIPDSYYKAKRTSLIFSAILLFLYFADPGAHATAPWLDIHVPIGTAAVLVWLGAAYYGAIFYWEWRLAKRLNGPLMAGGNFERLDQALEELRELFGRIGTKAKLDLTLMSSQMANVEIKFKTFPPEWEPAGNAAIKGLQGLIVSHGVTISPEQAINSAAKVLRSHFDVRFLEFESLAKRMEEVSAGAHAATVALDARIRGYQVDLRRLARDISRERLMIFYGFDLAPVGILLFLSTVSMLSIILHVPSTI